MPPTLTTPRLALRPLTLADLDFVAAMLADPAVMRFYPQVHTRAEAEGWVRRQLARYERDGHGLLLVEQRRTREPVGQVGLVMQEVDGAIEPEIGYLIDSRYWRRGFASEAAGAVRDYAFGELQRPYVISLIRPVNLPSQGVARRLGMTPQRETVFHDFVHRVYRLDRLDRVGAPPGCH